MINKFFATSILICYCNKIALHIARYYHYWVFAENSVVPCNFAEVHKLCCKIWKIKWKSRSPNYT